MEIKIINQRKFQILENHKIILELQYGKWWSNNAEFQYQGKNFEIKANGFWQNHFIILKDKIEFGKIKINWQQDSAITLTSQNGIPITYRISQESLWHSKYIVTSEKEPIFRIYAKPSWKKLNYDFQLILEDKTPKSDLNLLIAISIYLINNRLKSATAGASIAAVS
ncbi:hypothetical protein [Zunongwangia endophytica]|uniref:Aminotransferase n=1 Tax=Zunongwangia endophytica TaxID=1808945 RepID=A0ABV8H716_9FLAO|nr:hypothetical protein [Zunongwangia endophytica]MDN3595717.1 hypothetical protein [Zunongwangia endophytica]